MYSLEKEAYLLPRLLLPLYGAPQAATNPATSYLSVIAACAATSPAIVRKQPEKKWQMRKQKGAYSKAGRAIA